VAVEEDSTAAVAGDFMEAAERRFTVEGVLAAEVAPRTSAEARTVGIVAAPMQGAATTGAGATTVGEAVTAEAMGGEADIGAEDMVMDGAGELGLGGRIGVGAIRTRPITVPGITEVTLIILTRTTVLRMILGATRILTAGTTILPRRIPTHGRSRTKTDRREAGDRQYREEHPTRATQTATLRRVGRFCPLTG
jgi:hypothetical protein